MILEHTLKTLIEKKEGSEIILEFWHKGKVFRACLEQCHMERKTKIVFLKFKDAIFYEKQRKEWVQAGRDMFSCMCFNTEEDTCEITKSGTVNLNSKIFGKVTIFPNGQIHNKDVSGGYYRQKSTNQQILAETTKNLCQN